MKKILFLLVSILLLTACGKTDDSKKPEDNKEPIIEKKLNIIDLKSKSRPIAVMVNNHPQARPHSGLQDAYLSYEIIVEGGYSRIMALFKDKDTASIGSVRSARPYFLDYAKENEAIYTHFGGSDQALSDIKYYGIDNINGMIDSGFWRENLPVDYEHRAFTNIENIKKVIEKRKFETETSNSLILNYNVNEINLNGEDVIDANKIMIPYSAITKPNYIYDETTKKYNRFYGNDPHKDRVTGNQYTVKNIIVIKVDDFNLDSSGRKGLKNIGSGDGYFITNGKAKPIKWTKSERFSKTNYKFLDGSDVILNDGNTFIQIQPIKQILTIE